MRSLLIAASGYLNRREPTNEIVGRYFRLFVDRNNGGGYCEVAELEFLDAEGNDITDTVIPVVTHSTAYSGGTAGSKAIDGNLTTRWSGISAANEWLRFAFPTPVEIHGMSIVSVGSDMQQWRDRSIRDFKLQISTDGLNWTTVKEWLGEVLWSANEKRTFML